MNHTASAYELRYFVRKWNISTAQGVAILRKHGSDRTACNTAAMAIRPPVKRKGCHV